MPFSLMNGLSTMGAAVSQYAGAMGLDYQKAQLANQAQILADQLATTRETTLQGQQHVFQQQMETGRQGFQATQNTQQQAAEMERARLSESGASSRVGAQIAAENQRQQNLLNAPSPEIKSAQQFQKLTPEEKQAYREEMMTKAGLPAWMAEGIAGNSGAAPETKADGSVATPPGGKSDASVTGTTEPDATRNAGALQGIPDAAASIVKGMVDGRISPPSSFALSKPYWQGLLAKAAEYDPTFDQTTWAGRVATRKDFGAGQSAKAVTAMNTALSHAGTLLADFDAMGNFGGVLTPLNTPANAAARMFGGTTQVKAQETINALASEARRVFAASGGGNLQELVEWQKNFPLNGSPAQQKASLTGFVDLLDGRLQALSDQYNRGMGRTDDPINLLESHAREVYERLTGRQPENATGYQSGKPPAAAATKTAEPAAPASGDRTTTVAPPPPADPAAREIGKTYTSSTGQRGIWRGTGWEPAP